MAFDQIKSRPELCVASDAHQTQSIANEKHMITIMQICSGGITFVWMFFFLTLFFSKKSALLALNHYRLLLCETSMLVGNIFLFCCCVIPVRSHFGPYRRISGSYLLNYSYSAFKLKCALN